MSTIACSFQEAEVRVETLSGIRNYLKTQAGLQSGLVGYAVQQLHPHRTSEIRGNANL